jgi:NACalpha-BTF3-like transcription factor
MTITLEKVDEVIERTQVSYEKAKEALEMNDGDVVEAIVWIEKEETTKEKFTKHANSFTDEAIKMVKDLIKSGKVNRIIVEKDKNIIMNIPVTVGALGAFFLTSATVVGLVAALATGCVIKIHKENGEVINVNDEASKVFKNTKAKVYKHDTKTEETSEEKVNVEVKEGDNEDEVVVEIKEE